MFSMTKWENFNMEKVIKQKKVKSDFIAYLKLQSKTYGRRSVSEAVRTYKVSKAFGNSEDDAREEAIYTLQEHSYEF
jgi:hypothetical protein